jgi:hypothetical protein
MGLLLFLLGGGLFILRYQPPSAEADLYPVPDAIQYSATAWNLWRGLGFTVELGGRLHPPRYPIGFSLTLVPVFALGGTELHDASIAVLVTSMLLFLPLAIFARRLFGTSAAFWAVFFAGLSPLLIEHSTRVMSESLSVLLVAALFALESRGAGALCLGLLGGFAASVRYTNLMALLPSFLRVASSGSVRRRLEGLSGLALGAALFLVPLALEHQIDYGGVGRDGYHYWHPDRYENAGFTFSWSYAWRGPVVTWTSRPVGLVEQYARELAGFSRFLYSPAVALLALGGVVLTLVRERRQRRATGPPSNGSILRFWSYPAFLYVFYSFYYGEDRRFLLPALVVVAPFAGGMAQAFCARLGPRFQFLGGVALFAAVIATSAPSSLDRPPPRPQLRYLYAQQYDRILPKDAVLLTSLDVLYMEYYWRRDTQRSIVALFPDVPHATVIAPRPLPPNPHGSLRSDAFRIWALEHGAEEPVPVWRPGSDLLRGFGPRSLFLDLAEHESRALAMLEADGYLTVPLSPPGPRRLYRLQPCPTPLGAPGMD